MRQKGFTQTESQEAEESRLGLLDRFVPFFGCLVVIASISLLDAALIPICGTLPSEERNPFGSWLIEHVGQMGLFWTKMLGTVLVIAVLIFLKETWRPAALVSAAAVALFQIMLLIYLFT